jgi:UbiD family decarboxylase
MNQAFNPGRKIDMTNLSSIKMNKGKHGRMAMEKYHAQGQPCPVAISIGEDPMMFLSSVMSVPVDVEEYHIAGGLRGAPVEIVKSPLHGLPIPARGEIVLEGEIPPTPRFPRTVATWAKGKRPCAMGTRWTAC